MGSILVLYAFAGVFLFSGIRQVLLGVFTKWNKTNITFGVLALLWAFYEYVGIRMYNSKSQEEYLIYFKCIWLIPSVGGILQILFISFYTKVFDKTFFFVVLLLSIASFILNLLLPYGLAFDEITGFYIDKDFFSEPHAFLHGNISPFSSIFYVHIVLSFLYIMLALAKYYRRVRTKVAIALLLVFGLRSLLILCDILIGFIFSITYLRDLSSIILVMAINALLAYDVKRSEMIKMTILKEKELKTFKEEMIHYIVSDIEGLVGNLREATIHQSKEEIVVSAKVNSSNILNHVANVLDVYKFNESGIKLNISFYNLSQITNEVRSKVDPLLEVKQIVFESKNDIDYQVNVDVVLIERAFVNILHIVIGDLNDKSKITLEIQKLNERMLYICVTGNNPGTSIEGGYQSPENAFDSLFNGDYSNRYSLSFCKTVIRAHGGEIGFELVGICIIIWFTMPYVVYKGRLVSADNLVGQGGCSKEILFTAKELNDLYKYHSLFAETHFFEISKLRKIVAKIENDNTANKKWLSEINNSIAEMDKEKYQYLINLINPK